MKKQMTIAIAPNVKIDERYYEIFEFAERNFYDVSIISVIDDLRKMTFPISCQSTAYDLLSLAENQIYMNINEAIKSLKELYCRININIDVLSGSVIPNVLAHMERYSTDLLVIDPYTQDKQSLPNPKGVINQLMQCSPAPVWSIPKTYNPMINRVAVAIDLDNKLPAENADNQGLLSTAIDFARQNHASLSLLHAWHFEGESPLENYSNYTKDELSVLARAEHVARTKKIFQLIEAMEFDDLDINIDLVEGIPNIKIPEYTHDRKIDALIIGNHRDPISEHPFSNTKSVQLINNINCSLISCRMRN